MKIGFDNELYLKEQTEYILETAKKHDNKLYLECGGKLLHDMHATRVLPGYDENVKMKVFSSIINKIDIIICISSADIENKKMRADFGRSYADDVLKMIEDFKNYNIKCDKVVITRYNFEKSTDAFKLMLERQRIKVYVHKPIEGYPFDLDRIVSDQGYGANPYIETEKPVVIITAPGPGSGKLGTALSQVYHDYKRGIKSGYAKFETFPIWNLDINHPVNIAYESATADLGDTNLIDHFYFEKTGKIATNYNRDIEAFPVLKNILEKITGSSEYASPTHMGVNRCGFAISNDEVVREAGNNEIIRRYLNARVDYINGNCSIKTLQRCEEIMKKALLNVNMRPCVEKCKEKLEEQRKKGKGKDGITCTAIMQMDDGTFISGTNSHRMHAATALVFNALKYLAKIDDKIDLISPEILDVVLHMKKDILCESGTSLNLNEGLICLALSAQSNEDAKRAMNCLDKLKNLECHISHIPSPADMKSLKKLKINCTSEPLYP